MVHIKEILLVTVASAITQNFKLHCTYTLSFAMNTNLPLAFIGSPKSLIKGFVSGKFVMGST